MSAPKQKPNAAPAPTPASIAEMVKRSDDFGHEMRVGAAIQAAEVINFRHGSTYFDPVTQKPRQFDFRFEVAFTMQGMAFAAEAKNIDPTNPIIVCGRDRETREAFHDIIVSSYGPERRSGRATSFCQSTTTRTASLYLSGGFVGKSIVHNKPNSEKSAESEIYDRWAQALSSINDVILDAVEAAKTYNEQPFQTVALPLVIVPDGALWIAHYDEAGSLQREPYPTDVTTFFVGHEFRPVEISQYYEPVTISHVHFFTLTGLKIFLQSLKEDAATWTQWFREK